MNKHIIFSLSILLASCNVAFSMKETNKKNNIQESIQKAKKPKKIIINTNQSWLGLLSVTLDAVTDFHRENRIDY